jgi:hypothetical protein
MNQQPQQTEHATIWSAWRRYRFGTLLAALVGMLIYVPLIELFAPQRHPIATRLILATIFFWLTISAVYAVSARRRAALASVLLAALLLAAVVADLSMLTPQTHVLSHALAILFLGHIVIVLLEFVLHQSRVDTDTIFAALCIYLMLGIIWAFIYSLLELIQPGAFISSHGEGQQMRFGSDGTSVALYFSFVTMTTLGFGDITPVSASARALVTLQAICGQLYLTVLVAWLVGLHVSNARSDSSEAD